MDTIGPNLIIGTEFVIGESGGKPEPEPSPEPGKEEGYQATKLGQELYNALLPLTYTQ